MIPNLVQIPIVVYLTMALRRVYAQGAILSLCKAVALSVLFLLILAVWVQSAIMIGMRTV
jgi:hypothetical protein